MSVAAYTYRGIDITGDARYFVNGYFREQAITGQQRFAGEIADRLPRHLPRLTELRASTRAQQSRALQWIELQSKVPRKVGTGLLISLTGRTPVRATRQLVTVFDMFPLTHPEWYSRQFRLVHGNLLRHHFRHADGLIVISEPVREAVTALVDPGTPVVVAACAPSKHVLTPEPNYAPDTPYFLTVGSLEPRKNLPRLISAYGLLDPRVRAATPLLVAGGGGVAGIFAQTGIADSVIPEGVRFLGRVTDNELSALYRNATAFVSASLDEGFGLPLIEAAQITNGVLVLSDIPIYRWVMGAAPAQYFDPMEIESIAGGLSAALRLTADTESLRALAAKFSWDESARVVAELARQISAN